MKVSDQLRYSAFGVVKKHFGFSQLEVFQPDRVRDMFDALRNMGFEVAELGGCTSHVPMVAPGRTMVAIMTTFGTAGGWPHVTVAARDEKQMLRAVEILKDLEIRWRPAP